MATQDDELMFAIGVFEHPQIKSRMNAIAKSVETMQKEMNKGFMSVGQGVESAKNSMVGLVDQMKSFRDGSVAAASDIRSAMSQMNASLSGGNASTVLDEIKQLSNEAANALNDLEKAKNAAVGGTASGGGGAPTVTVPDLELPSNLRNVFKQLEGAAEDAAVNIESALNDAIVGLPTSVQAQTSMLSNEWKKRAVDQSAAYAAMASDLDGYLAKEGSATEQIQANMRKAQSAVDGYADKQHEAQEKIQQASIKSVRALVQGAKGFAEIGLMSEENSQKFLQSMAVIQGAFDIFESGADLLESYNNGMKGMKAATDAATKSATVQKALAGTQFVQMKAYQAQLAQETIAANIATAANQRLAASRGVGGVGSAVAGAASSAIPAVGSAVGSAAGAGGAAAAGGGAAAAGAGGVAASAVAIAGVAAAVVGSLGILYMAIRQAAEAMQGKAQSEKSFAMQSANTQMSIYSSALRMTGMFEKADSVGTRMANTYSSVVDAVASWIPVSGRLIKSLNLIGDVANMTASKAAVERSQKRLGIAKIDRTANDEIDDLKRDAGRSRFDNDFKYNSESLRSEAGKTGAFDIESGKQGRVQGQIQTQLAKEQKTIDEYSSGVGTDKTAYEAAVKNASQLRSQLQKTLDIQNRMAMAKGDTQAAAELDLQSSLMDQLAAQQTKLNAMKSDGVTSEKEMADAVSFHQSLVDKLNGSYDKQRGIIKDTASEQIATEQRKQEMIKGQLDLQTAQIQKIEDQYRSAGLGFAKLGEIEKQMAAEALQQAKTKGAASLEDYQKDLLRQVGSAEATRFANEGDMAEAKKFGFDSSFGDSINQERKMIESTRTSLEAQLSTSYDVQVKLQTNADDVSNMIVDKVNKLRQEDRAYTEELINTKLGVEVAKIRDKQTFEKNEMAKNKK
jgi:hypothetical protein